MEDPNSHFLKLDGPNACFESKRTKMNREDT